MVIYVSQKTENNVKNSKRPIKVNWPQIATQKPFMLTAYSRNPLAQVSFQFLQKDIFENSDFKNLAVGLAKPKIVCSSFVESQLKTMSDEQLLQMVLKYMSKTKKG